MIPRKKDHNRQVSDTSLSVRGMWGWGETREEIMWMAAVSAILAPTCRYSQKGVKKLLLAAAAGE